MRPPVFGFISTCPYKQSLPSLLAEMVPKLWEEIARMNTELNRRKQLEPIDQQAMYKAEREFYIKHCGEPDPKDGPLSKSLLGQRLAALEEKGIFYRPINRLLYKPTAERLQSGFLEYAAVELKRELDVIKSADLDWAILGPVRITQL